MTSVPLFDLLCLFFTQLEKYRAVKDQLHASQKKLQTFAEEMHTILDAKDKELR